MRTAILSSVLLVAAAFVGVTFATPGASACPQPQEGPSPCDPTTCLPESVQPVCVHGCLRYCPEASVSLHCVGTATNRVCYDPYDLSCFVGVQFSVSAVSGSACVDWCKLIPCPGPVIGSSIGSCVTPISGGDIEETYCVHPGDHACIIEHREVTFTGTTDTCTPVPGLP
ncbi:MAG: hypothetical protein QOE90_1432 [Thermoplasmata archaeon]|jgi:hypothetical protein|nr:hypothetical protein [Thermoplasmata archaeon]